jgi:hypothetical protein
MTFIKSWEDFEKAAEKLYLANPMKVNSIESFVRDFSMKRYQSQSQKIIFLNVCN